MQTFTRDDVNDALRVCFDPELPVNIVDLGLVYAIEVNRDWDAPGVDPRYAVRITLSMRAPNDEREAMLLAQVHNRLMGMQEVSWATVNLTWEPAWSADRISVAARRELGLDRPATPTLINISL